MEALIIGIVVGIFASAGFLSLGYTLGVHTISTEDAEKVEDYKNKVLNKLIQRLNEMKTELEDCEENNLVKEEK